MTQIIQCNYDDLHAAIRSCLLDCIVEIKAIPEPDSEPDKITRDEVRKMTGKSDSWIYQKTMRAAKDPLPFTKFGRELVFSKKAIQAYIDSHTMPVKSYSEDAAEKLRNNLTR